MWDMYNHLEAHYIYITHMKQIEGREMYDDRPQRDPYWHSWGKPGSIAVSVGYVQRPLSWGAARDLSVQSHWMVSVLFLEVEGGKRGEEESVIEDRKDNKKMKMGDERKEVRWGRSGEEGGKGEKYNKWIITQCGPLCNWHHVHIPRVHWSQREEDM